MKNLWPILFYISALLSALPSYAEIYKGEPYSDARRKYSVGWYLVKYVSNEETDPSGKPISQEEISRFSYLLHYYQFSLEELLAGEQILVEEANYQGISLDQLADAFRVLHWYINVKKGMNAQEEKTGMRCKFGAYAELDRAMEKMKREKAELEESLPKDRDIEQAWNTAFGEAAAKEQKIMDTRQVLGLCWDADKYRD